MLISKNDILQHKPPFLMLSATQEWLLVENISKNTDIYILNIVEKKDGKFHTRSIQLYEAPFYVGAYIWELNYGTTLMTLYHDTLDQHPAKTVWMEWLSIKD